MTTATAESKKGSTPAMPVGTYDVQQIDIGRLVESPTNPRRTYNDKALEELAANVRRTGYIINPLLCRPWPVEVTDLYTKHNTDALEIVAGHRRARAAKMAGLKVVPTIVRTLTDEQVIEIQATENLLREDVHPLEEAEGYERLIKLWRARKGTISGTEQDVAAAEIDKTEVAEIASRVGKSISYVYQRLKLLDLIEPVRKAFTADHITAGHAILIARLQPVDQALAMKASFDTRWSPSENRDIKATISVRELDAWIGNNVTMRLEGAPWDKADAELAPAAGACTTCPKASGNNPDLFGGMKGNRCTDRVCFNGKMTLHIAATVKALEAEGGKVPVARISTVYAGGAGDRVPAGALPESKWHAIAANAKRCEQEALGVYVDGAQVGKTTRVCLGYNSRTCKVHLENWQRTAVSSPSQRASSALANLKARRNAELRRRVLTAVMAKVKEPTATLMRATAQAMLRELWAEARKDLARALGLLGKDASTSSSNVDKVLKAGMAKADTTEAFRMLVATSIARDLGRGDGGYVGGSDELMARAKDLKVDTGAIARAVAKDMPAAKKKAKAAKKAAPKASKKAKAKTKR